MNKIPFYSRFIAGTKLQNAINLSKKLQNDNIGTIYDFSVESSKNLNRNIDEIFKQINLIDSSYIALKFSSLGINNISNCKNLITQFYKENINKKNPNKFLIDAEYNRIQDDIYYLSDYAIDNYNNKNNKYFYKTLQMYRNDVWNIFETDINNFMTNEKYALKLVRGAYMATDKNIILNSKWETDQQYNNAIDYFFNNLNYYNNNELIIATHNIDSYNLSKKYITDKNKNNIYFATLLGMGNNICYDNTYNKIKYVPYGPYFETTPYLIRRLIENKDIIKHIV